MPEKDTDAWYTFALMHLFKIQIFSKEAEMTSILPLYKYRLITTRPREICSLELLLTLH